MFPKDDLKDEENYLWLKMPEDINVGAWDPQYDSNTSKENSDLYKMNSMDRCKFLNDRILKGALKKCALMLEN